jgi:hypothetical protein
VRTPTENQSELWFKTRQARERISGFYQLFSSSTTSSSCEPNAANLLAAASEWIFFCFRFAALLSSSQLSSFSNSCHNINLDSHKQVGLHDVYLLSILICGNRISDEVL